MADPALPSSGLLRNILEYDPDTGVLTWRPRSVEMFDDGRLKTAQQTCASWNARWAGRPALNSRHATGYLVGRIFGLESRSHRVIWKMVTGDDPKGVIDHINGDKADNRLSNLRDIPRVLNSRNCKNGWHGASGSIGVVWHKRTGKWHARIGSGQSRKHLGTFDNFDAAVAARKLAEQELGYHANHGRPLGP